MKTFTRLRRFSKLGLLGGIAVVALLGAACSSDSGGAEASDGSGDTTGGATGTGAATTTTTTVAAAGLDGRGYAEDYRLVSTDWVEEHLDDDSVVVIDLRSAEDYAAGHVPGAVNLVPSTAFSRKDENGVAGQIALADQVASALGSAGVTPETTVVFYDGNGSLWSARALWVLDVYGHADTRIMDGAWPLWSEEGREVSTEAPQVAATEYVFSGEPNQSIIAGFEEMVAAINDPEKLICDARSAEEYAGRDVRSAQGGHVPGALNEDWRQAIDDQGQFRPASELRGVYEDTGLVSDDEKTIYVYCQTGVRAAHTWFVLHDLLGLDNVKNYDGSWEEYGNRTDAEIDRS